MSGRSCCRKSCWILVRGNPNEGRSQSRLPRIRWTWTSVMHTRRKIKENLDSVRQINQVKFQFVLWKPQIKIIQGNGRRLPSSREYPSKKAAQLLAMLLNSWKFSYDNGISSFMDSFAHVAITRQIGGVPKSAALVRGPLIMTSVISSATFKFATS